MKVQVSLDMSHNVYIKILILICTYQCKPLLGGGEGGEARIGGLMTKLIPSLRHFLTCLSPGWGGLNSAQPVRRLNLLMRMSSDA
jgi:hypothetical protein